MTTPHDKALTTTMQDIPPDRVNRLWWLLFIMSKSGGETNASESRWNWINAFCDDFDDDTFNLAIDLKLIRCTHDSDTDNSTAWLTDGGKALVAYFSAPPAGPIPEAGNGDGWLPIERADRTITDVQDFSEVGITLRMSDRYWVRDEDGRVYEAAWSEDNGRDFWWDFEAESPVDPIEFMPHPLDPRFRSPPTIRSNDTGREG